MKKYVSFVGLMVLLSVVILGFMQFTNTTPAYAMLPCCNNLGGALCDPNSPMWEQEWWSCLKDGKDYTIDKYACYEN